MRGISHNFKFWIPMSLTIFRLIVSPILVLQTHANGFGPLFLLLFVLGFAADVLDGQLARRLGVVSRLGSVLDSIADAAFWACTGVSLYIYNSSLAPWFVPLLWLAVASTFACWSVGLCKFGRLPTYHTTLDKCVAIGLFLGVTTFLTSGFTELLLTGLLLLFVANGESLLTTLVLPEFACDLRNLSAAIKLRAAAQHHEPTKTSKSGR